MGVRVLTPGAKPTLWVPNRHRIAPAWQWAWDHSVLFAPFWKRSGVPDDIIRNRPGTFSGSPAWIIGSQHQGPALDFTRGDADRLDYSNDAVMQAGLGGPCSFETVAFLPSGATDANQYICAVNSSQTTFALIFWWSFSSPNLLLRFQHQTFADPGNGQSALVEMTTDFPRDRWVHAVATYPGGLVAPSIYLDGLVRTDITTNTGNNTASLEDGTIAIGGRTQDSLRNTDADIAYMRIWDHELTPSQIVQLYQDPYGMVRPVRFGSVLVPVSDESKTDTDNSGWDEKVPDISPAPNTDQSGFTDVTSALDMDDDSADSGWAEQVPDISPAPNTDNSGWDDSTKTLTAAVGATDTGGFGEGTPDIALPGTDQSGWTEAASIAAAVSATDQSGWAESSNLVKQSTIPTDTDTSGFSESASIAADATTTDSAGATFESVSIAAALSAELDDGGFAEGTPDLIPDGGTEIAGFNESVAIAVGTSASDSSGFTERFTLTVAVVTTDESSWSETSVLVVDQFTGTVMGTAALAALVSGTTTIQERLTGGTSAISGRLSGTAAVVV